MDFISLMSVLQCLGVPVERDRSEDKYPIAIEKRNRKQQSPQNGFTETR